MLHKYVKNRKKYYQQKLLLYFKNITILNEAVRNLLILTIQSCYQTDEKGKFTQQGNGYRIKTCYRKARPYKQYLYFLRNNLFNLSVLSQILKILQILKSHSKSIKAAAQRYKMVDRNILLEPLWAVP